jgi:hypothetical protein
MIIYSLCYEIITHESAENGEAAEHGWLGAGDWEVPLQDADGYHQDVIELAKNCEFERKGSLVDVIREVQNRGLRWNGSWFESVDAEIDYETGEIKTYSLHINSERAAEAVRFATYGDLKIV